MALCRTISTLEFFALGLVLVGSLLHLGWNIFAKKAKNGFIFLWIAATPLSLVGAYYTFKNQIWATLDRTTFICILLSGIIHPFYFATLVRAYKVADLSFVYPVCRSMGATLVVSLGILFLGEEPTRLGTIGILLCIVAPLLEPIVYLISKKKKVHGESYFITIITGLLIGAYLFVDKIGSRHVPAFYYLIYFIFPTHLFMGLAILFSSMRKEVKNENFIQAFWGCLFWSSAYGVVIWAMKLAPVSYVASARASGIVMSALAGKIFFTEELSRMRLFSVFLIVLGVVLIAL